MAALGQRTRSLLDRGIVSEVYKSRCCRNRGGLPQWALEGAPVAEPDQNRRKRPPESPGVDALRETRRDLRFRLDVEVKIQSPSMGPVPGQTLDISDRGLSATLPVELPVEEVVELNLNLRIGVVNVHATVRNRNAFRHGFQFVEPNPALHLIRENCCLLEQIP